VKKRNEISERLFKFAIRVIKFLRTVPNAQEYQVIRFSF